MRDETRASDDATIDEAAAWIHRAGWSVGDLATTTEGGVIWTVFARRSEHRIVVRARTQEDAWRLALDAAERLAD